jgi:hypothetical protein
MRSNPNFARQQVAALRHALLSANPESIQACLPRLADAAQHIGGDDLDSLIALKNELRAARFLVEHGDRLNRGLARILGEQLAEYTPSGDSTALPGRGTISVEG